MNENRYRKIKTLSKNETREVYLAYDKILEKQWIIKEVQSLEETEVYVLKTIICEYFPRIVDGFIEEGKQWIVMDYIEGSTLEDIIQVRRITIKEAEEIFMKICSAIKELHKRSEPILYLDLKPSNIIINGRGQLFLIDFGSCYRKNMDNYRASGTIGYAAPELLHFTFGNNTLKEYSDYFSLGMVLFSILDYKKYGLPLVQTKNISEKAIQRMLPHAPKYLCDIIAKCIKGKGEDRYQEIEQIVVDFTEKRVLPKVFFEKSEKNTWNLEKIEVHSRCYKNLKWILK
ncbi:MAG: protein kinase domain-containing protein [Lachnospiraceae bacterium]